MAVSRAKKQETIEQLTSALSDAQLVVLLHNNGLTVAEVSELRRKVRAAGAGYKVAKNTLTKRVIKDTPFAGLDNLLKGPIRKMLSLLRKLFPNMLTTMKKFKLLAVRWMDRFCLWLQSRIWRPCLHSMNFVGRLLVCFRLLQRKLLEFCKRLQVSWLG